ncbi:MAG: hypothetical protein PHS31_06775 [Victivallaceae bacterium]|nr:hypothetical protein [Victivallaceae bacterium]
MSLKTKYSTLICFLLCAVSMSAALSLSPKYAQAVMAGFTKVVIKWQPVKDSGSKRDIELKLSYANLAERSGESNLVPMRLSMNTSLPLSSFKVKFEYQGESQLPDFASAPTAITGDAIKNIPFTTGKTYKDYTVLKKNVLRVWAGVTSHTVARKANKFGTKSDSSLTDPDGNYLAPVASANDAYPAELLFNGQSGPGYSINLWVEGINPSDATRVKATLLYQAANSSWSETVSDAVKIKVAEGNLTVNVNGYSGVCPFKIKYLNSNYL